MKALWITLLAVFTSGFTIDARADFACSTADGGMLHLYEPKPARTRTYSAVWLSGEELSSFSALPTLLEESTLYSKFEYKLWSANGEAAFLSLTGTVKLGRGGCGRGGCISGPKKYEKITAKYLQNGAETVLLCEESSF